MSVNTAQQLFQSTRANILLAFASVAPSVRCCDNYYKFCFKLSGSICPLRQSLERLVSGSKMINGEKWNNSLDPESVVEADFYVLILIKTPRRAAHGDI